MVDGALTNASKLNDLGRKGLETAAFLAVLVTTVIRSVTTSDLVFGDETSYLRAGLIFAREGVAPAFTGGGLYSDTYALLSFVIPDEVGLYFAGRALSAVTFVLGVWLATRLLAGPFLAWPAGAVTAALPVTYTWPGVAGLAAGFVVLSVALVVRFRSLALYGLATASAWLGAAARPEYVWLATFMSAATVGWVVYLLIRRRDSTRVSQMIGSLAGAVVVPLVLISFHGNPFASSRSWVAFSQHFALRNARPGEDPWLEAADVVSRSFPNASSLPQALIENPTAVLSHVFGNAQDLGAAIQSQVLGLSGTVVSLLTLSMAVALGLSFLASLFFSLGSVSGRFRLLVQRVFSPHPFPGQVVSLATAAIALLLATTPLFAMYPRDHYLVVPVGLSIVLLLALQRQLGSPALSQVLPLLLVLVLFGIVVADSIRAVANRVVYPAPVARSVALLAQSERDWVLVSNDWGANTFLDVFVPDVEIVSLSEMREDESVQDFFERRAVNGVWRPLDLVDQGFSTQELSSNELLVDGGVRLNALFPGSAVFLLEADREVTARSEEVND